MDLIAGDPAPSDPARLRLELERCANRLRSMPLARLSAPGPAGSRAFRAVRVAQRLVDLTTQLVGPPDRQLPQLPDHAAGDVLEVVGNDLLAALAEWPIRAGAAQGDPAEEAEIVAAAVEALVALRLRL